jgi:ElaB/YqjD/DUF883 family membrane-anchored ribosome-binding protein
MSILKDASRVAGSEVNKLLLQAQALVDATAGDQEARVQAAREALGDCLKSARDAAHEAEGRILETFRATDTAVREKPYYAMGGACLGGLFLGWLLARKPR